MLSVYRPAWRPHLGIPGVRMCVVCIDPPGDHTLGSRVYMCAQYRCPWRPRPITLVYVCARCGQPLPRRPLPRTRMCVCPLWTAPRVQLHGRGTLVRVGLLDPMCPHLHACGLRSTRGSHMCTLLCPQLCHPPRIPLCFNQLNNILF